MRANRPDAPCRCGPPAATAALLERRRREAGWHAHRTVPTPPLSRKHPTSSRSKKTKKGICGSNSRVCYVCWTGTRAAERPRSICWVLGKFSARCAPRKKRGEPWRANIAGWSPFDKTTPARTAANSCTPLPSTSTTNKSCGTEGWTHRKIYRRCAAIVIAAKHAPGHRHPDSMSPR